MQPSYFSGLLCFSKPNTQVHNHSVPTCTSRLERKRGSTVTAAEEALAKRTSSGCERHPHCSNAHRHCKHAKSSQKGSKRRQLRA